MSPQTQTNPLIKEVQSVKEYFERSARVLDEADSNFRPKDGMMTVAQQVAHAAQTIDWFIEGASRPEGFDLDFEKHAKAVDAVTSLAAARQWMNEACDRAIAFLSSKSAADLARPLPPGPVMGGEPVSAIVSAMVDHSAHHRGALTVYSRLIGKTPLMPYMEM